MSIVMQINPFEFFTDASGDALDAGYIYIGEVNKDPRQYPIIAYYDDALTVPAPMPLRTSNGYIVRSGTPTFLYISGNYSIRVEDKNHRQIYYVPDFLFIGSNSAVSTADLSNSTDPTKGAALVGWKRAGLSSEIKTVAQMLSAQMVNIWEFAGLVTNIASYPTNPALCDWAPALMAAFATGKKIYAPAVPAPYWLLSKVVMPNGVCSLVGDGDSTLFMVGAAMNRAFERLDDASVGALSPVTLEDFKIDCNRLADYGHWIESSKKGSLQNVTVVRFLVTGGKVGSPSGVGARYYENEIAEMKYDGGIEFSGTSVGMAIDGLVIDLSATDNVVYHPVVSYITGSGLYVLGGSNKIVRPHAYGNNTSDTGPAYGVSMAGYGSITDPHCDNVTVAGISIRSRKVQLIGGSHQWAADNTPSLGGATCIEINTGLNEIVILGGISNGANASNPTIRYLGTKPDRSTIMGFVPFTPNAGETNSNSMYGQFGVKPRVGARSLIGVDTATATSGAFQLSKNGELRYEFSVTTNNETGGDVGSGLSMTALMDDGVTVAEFMHYYREFKQLELLGKVRIGATSLGFFDKNPITKPTITGSRGGNAALASLCAALDSLGLANDDTTA